MLDNNPADDAQIAAAQEGEQPAPSDGAAPPPDLGQLQAQAQEAHDQMLRAQAELDNYRKRARKQHEDDLRYANLPLLRDLLPVVDNIGRAIEAAEKGAQTPESAKLLEGFTMVARQLGDVLARHHCQRIAAAGEAFDPNLHEAILQQPAADVPPGQVVTVVQEGYQLHDRVVRPSQVIVSAAME